jgi:hypothetical protein
MTTPPADVSLTDGSRREDDAGREVAVIDPL